MKQKEDGEFNQKWKKYQNLLLKQERNRKKIIIKVIKEILVTEKQCNQTILPKNKENIYC